VSARTLANRRFFDEEAPRIARLCHRMAERFARGGRLAALGRSATARSDARHVAVEFVHPVIVGTRALPALALVPEGGPLLEQARLILRPDDMVIAFGLEEEVQTGETWGALEHARALGCLTVGFAPFGGDWVFVPETDDPFVRQELVETLYHVLWELVHVFFEHPGLLEGRRERRVHAVGASRFLYPFLAEEERDPAPVTADVARSVRMKAREVGALRERTIAEGRDAILGAAAELRSLLDAGGTLLVFGNGGSATDAMDVVADFRAPRDGWRPRPALDLTEDAGILTALGNDVGVEETFARQIIAYGDAGDAAVALSTSGSSRNVVRALEEARRRGLRTFALLGYDGGRINEEKLADHVFVAPSEHIPRIQEAQASIYHILRELVEVMPGAVAREP
jgi:D-sedoheptulose 7-phosphate isomerase